MALFSPHQSYHLPLLSSRGWKLCEGLFSPLYKCQSQASVSKISKVSSSQGKLNHFVQNSPWRSSNHTSSTNIQRYLCLCVEYTQRHSVFKTTAVIKSRGSGIRRKRICLMASEKNYWGKEDIIKTWIKTKGYIFSANICQSMKKMSPIAKRPNRRTQAIKVEANALTLSRVPINPYCSAGCVLLGRAKPE